MDLQKRIERVLAEYEAENREFDKRLLDWMGENVNTIVELRCLHESLQKRDDFPKILADNKRIMVTAIAEAIVANDLIKYEANPVGDLVQIRATLKVIKP